MIRQIELLNERIHLMEMVNDANIDGIIIYDTDLKVVYWNKTSEAITGIPRHEATGRHINELFPHFSSNKEIQNAIGHTLKGRKTFVPYEKCADKDGYFERHFVPLMAEGDEVSGILSIVHDVAHRVKIEKELKSLNRSLVKKNKELKHMNAELLAFSHVTSHELKEPLHKIYSLAELLQNKDVAVLSETGKMYFKRIQAAAQRMRLLTDDILAYSEINTQKKDLATVDLNKLALAVTDELQTEISQKNASVKVEGLPVIKGYRSLLITLFRNLISNALKFQKEGNKPEIVVTSGALSGEEIIHPDALADTKYIRISVSDNGIGFEQAKAEQLFQMFYRVHPNCYPGTGIGLTVCRKIAELHGGFITADGRDHAGSTFNVFLPAGKS